MRARPTATSSTPTGAGNSPASVSRRISDMPGDTMLRQDAAVADAAVAAEALAGLLAPRKTLPPKLFYDEEGCRLFGEITRLPEYYVTRTERALLDATAPEIGRIAPEHAALVE